jgi:hypothetical protein
MNVRKNSSPSKKSNTWSFCKLRWHSVRLFIWFSAKIETPYENSTVKTDAPCFVQYWMLHQPYKCALLFVSQNKQHLMTSVRPTHHANFISLMSHSVKKRKISFSEEIRCCEQETHDRDYHILIRMVFAARTFTVDS